jgi:hypothetical protein
MASDLTVNIKLNPKVQEVADLLKELKEYGVITYSTDKFIEWSNSKGWIEITPNYLILVSPIRS